ncbi:MAG: hypothetical protein IT323_00430 [Anaerolineae bacterium]|nr:hypothetical protein [Anaerolineae bacterium]
MAEPIVTVNSLVPFGDSLFWWLGKTRADELQELIEHSRRFDRAYLAWELVRRKRNPFFLEGTGFEGYLIGAAHSPDEALHHVLRIGEGMLRTMLTLHRNDPRFRNRLMKALNGELEDPEAIEEWAAQLGATLARLRVNLLNNPQADAFHNSTYRMVGMLPPIAYHEGDDSLKQTYVLAAKDSLDGARMSVDPHVLKPSEQDAWMVVQGIGKFGHPLVRQYIESA